MEGRWAALITEAHLTGAMDYSKWPGDDLDASVMKETLVIRALEERMILGQWKAILPKVSSDMVRDLVNDIVKLETPWLNRKVGMAEMIRQYKQMLDEKDGK